MTHPIAPLRVLPRRMNVGRALYMDRRMVVLNKSPGAEAQVGLSRLSDIATEYTSQLAENDALFPVHRLDKATTGCLVFGRSKDMARELSRQFQDRTIEKTYYALVRGGSESFKRTAGIIDGAVEVLPYSNATLTHSEHEFPHKTSLTEWELVGSSPILPLTLLKLRLLTGHKHQLRIHLSKFLRTPILGDSRHSISKPTRSITDLLHSLQIPSDRLFLHSSYLGMLRHIKTGKRLRLGIQAPLPKDFSELLVHAQIHFDSDISLTRLYVDGEALSHGTIPELSGQLLA